MLLDASNSVLACERDQLTPDLSDPLSLLSTLEQLRDDVSQEGRAIFARWRSTIRRRAFLISGLNLACYLALRRRDLRPLQTALMPWGLSSLGRSEARVLPNLDAVIATLHAICRAEDAAPPCHPPLRVFFQGERLLQCNVAELFGPIQAQRRMRIMVTLPSEAADDVALVHDLVARGMDCARINCAHGTPAVWERMIANIRRAAAATGRGCRVLMDIAGPKPRTDEVIVPAVEIGYQRLAEIQEEILWLCEAAHVPVIWATQVLESFVRKGIPSRAEMTDAAMAERAECVMLNKGPYVTEAVTILDDVLRRMQAHQVKKTPQLRALSAWDQSLPR